MARTGRPPKSTEQHILQGTHRSDRHASLPLLEGGRGTLECPEHLKGSARVAYEAIAADLSASGILDKADNSLLATAAMHYGVAVDAASVLEKLGLVYPVTRGARDGAGGYKVVEANPAVRILRDALCEYRQCCDLLGVGPSARARLANFGVRGRDAALDIPGLSDGPTKKVINLASRR